MDEAPSPALKSTVQWTHSHPFESLVVFLLIATAMGMTERNQT
jgi:hypothetical protein